MPSKSEVILAVKNYIQGKRDEDKLSYLYDINLGNITYATIQPNKNNIWTVRISHSGRYVTTLYVNQSCVVLTTKPS